jgi:uncharacterized protein (DUF1800 family)
MGDATTPLTLNEARHLLRRTGFGGAVHQEDALELVGVPRGEVVADLVEFKPSRFAPKGDTSTEIQDKWIKYMLRYKKQLQEKLVVFWHDHFATSAVDVDDERMIQQNETLRKHCTGVHRTRREQTEQLLPPRGNFKDFVKAINKDPAMMQFLNTTDNRKENPNENYSRELEELFTLGVFDFAGNPNYTQSDVFQIARAFTGWRTRSVRSYKREAFLDGNRHDFMADWPARGPKVIFKSTGGFGAGGRDYTVNGEGEKEIDTVIDIIFEHTDTDGKNTVARYVTRRMIEYLAHPNPDVDFVDDVIDASNFDTAFDVREMVRAILVDDRFYETMVPAGASTRKSVKFPVDFVVGTLRMLRIRPKRAELKVNDLDAGIVRNYLTEMGMTLLEPPSVFGWPWESAWLGSTRMQKRYQFAVDVTRAAGAGTASVRFDKLFDLTLTDPETIVLEALKVLQVEDQFSAAERQTLENYLGPGPIDFISSQSTINNKLRGLFALIIQSPAYQVY